ncbi:MAG TPA: phosphatase PAP2 family protein [Acidimicrobiales bacterium]|nr:phosphatase PAP2 family protein [Acidimicrobiales bacterium]
MSGAEPEEPEPPAPELGSRLRWWKEALYIAVFYGVYSFIRNTQGSAAVSAAHAFSNAREVIRIEEALGLYFEEAVQEAFLDWRPFIQFWNLFYGTFHFVVTIVALVLLFRRFPDRYPRWRNTLAATTGLALIGFATYPLMPPRLLPASYGFVDTLRAYGGLWSFESGPVAQVSNQYAAMPSLHFAWSLWSALVLYPMLVRPWSRLAIVLYPPATLFAIVVTANHYWLDAAGGALVLGVGAAVGFALASATARHPAEEAVPNRA